MNMEQQVRALIEEMQVVAGKLARDQDDENAMRTARALSREAIRLESLLSAIEHVQKQ